VILDTSGAETLLGKGDLLYLHPEVGHPVRAQGVMVSDHEIRKVIAWWQKQEQQESTARLDLGLDTVKTPTTTGLVEELEPDATDEVPWEKEVQSQDQDNGDESLIKQATELVRVKRRASASYLQRHLRLGYPRAAWLIEELESRGVLGPPAGSRREREILLPEPGDEDETEEMVE